jgi:hypothetical protein
MERSQLKAPKGKEEKYTPGAIYRYRYIHLPLHLPTGSTIALTSQECPFK